MRQQNGRPQNRGGPRRGGPRSNFRDNGFKNRRNGPPNNQRRGGPKENNRRGGQRGGDRKFNQNKRGERRGKKTSDQIETELDSYFNKNTQKEQTLDNKLKNYFGDEKPQVKTPAAVTKKPSEAEGGLL